MRDSLLIDLKVKLNNNQFSPNAISHKELNALLNKAKKEISTIESFENDEIDEKQKFKDLITEWKITSKKVLLMLNKKDQLLTKNINPKSLMAFGAMGAHINMAFQALKSTEYDQDYK
tara:strand:+ start:667 stop:1020 length:354 start_codon:yes stop_codon:yes gene_type:complete